MIVTRCGYSQTRLCCTTPTSQTLTPGRQTRIDIYMWTLANAPLVPLPNPVCCGHPCGQSLPELRVSPPELWAMSYMDYPQLTIILLWYCGQLYVREYTHQRNRILNCFCCCMNSLVVRWKRNNIDAACTASSATRLSCVDGKHFTKCGPSAVHNINTSLFLGVYVVFRKLTVWENFAFEANFVTLPSWLLLKSIRSPLGEGCFSEVEHWLEWNSLRELRTSRCRTSEGVCIVHTNSGWWSRSSEFN